MNNELKSFKDLKVWQKAADLATLIYRITEKFPRSELYGIVNQMRRAVISISSNLAEGFKRNHNKEKLQFYNIAYSSTSELESQIEISKKLGFLLENDYQILILATIEVSKMMGGLIKSLNSKSYVLNSTKGFSLLELLIYIAIFGTVVLATTNVLVTVFEGRDSANARYEVIQNIRFASEKIRQLIYDASSFTVSGACPFNVLEAIISGTTTTVAINGGILQTVSGGNTSALTSDLVTATSTNNGCLFAKISNPSPAKSTLQMQFTISYNNNGNQQLNFSDSIKTTISQRQ